MAATATATVERVEDLTGLQKVAILIMYLQRDVAKVVLRQFNDEEVKQLGLAISTVQVMPEATIEKIVIEFIGALQEVNLMPVSGMEFAREVLPGLVDDDRRDGIAGAIRRRVGSDFEDFIKSRPAIAVAGVLAEEHPQVRAVALLRMGSENAARVLSLLDEDAQFDLTMRMAKADRVSGDLADDVERSVRRALEDQDDSLQIGGAQTTARILGRMPRERNTLMLARMRTESADLAQIIQQLMVTFEDLDALDDRGIQALLRTVDRNDLVIALKAAKPALRDRFLKNLSSRAAADLVEEMDILGTPRKSDVKRAQEAITTLAQRLSDEGVITLVPAGGED